MKTFSAKTHEADRKWIVVDAEGVVVGRLATFIAM
ncbi:MAG: 50S ribosomal protein L13, partial [Hyphomonadaceae bacterium]|eukprot:gene31985-32675_t